jgi:hypothetical protein
MADNASQLPAKPRAAAYGGKGRPSIYTEELGEEICHRIANGETLAEICRDPHMPWPNAIREDWLKRQPEFARRYASARTVQPEAIVERGFAVAMLDTTQFNANASRLQWDVCRWTAGRLDPRWSDKTEVSVTVQDTEAGRIAGQQRAELIAALQRLAKPTPMIDGEAEPEEESSR